MKKCTIICAALTAMTFSSIAQPGDMQPPHDKGGPWEHGRMAAPGSEPASPLHQLMDDLRTQDPEKYDRLQTLRRTDPNAFRQAARDLIHTAALEKLKAERPEIYTAVLSLNANDQDWLLDTMAISKLLDHHGKRWKKMDKDDSKKDRKHVYKLVKEYQKAGSDEEKSAIRAELKGYISAQYDQRLEMRAAQMQEMADKIGQIQRAAEQAELDRDAIIEEKVNFLLNSEWQHKKGRK